MIFEGLFLWIVKRTRVAVSPRGNVRQIIMEEHDQEGNNSMDTYNDQECEDEDCDPTEDDNNEEEFSLEDVLRLGGTKVSF